ncbi:MAG: hypothetical protein ACLRMZ_28240 [Blautia marasmi]
MMTLVIMAAGMGSRYGGLKQIDPVGRHGNLFWIIPFTMQSRQDLKKWYLLLKRKSGCIPETVGKRLEKVIPVAYAFQEIDQVPEGVQVPEGAHQTMGYRTRCVELPGSGGRAFCRHQRR